MSADGHELHNIVQRLQRADAFPHPSSQFEVIETHISLVLLTGDFAYKLKKPVDLGFLDFSTEEKREHYCHEEVRLNRRLAPEIYLGVVAITQGKNGPEVGGKGPTIWHAVKMRQFKRDHELDVLVPRGGLTRTHVDLLAIDIARFHQHCERSAEDSQYGTPETVSSHILECFELSEPCVRREQRARLSMLQDWCVEALRNSSGALQERKLEGYVREGHGDLHLRNMVLLEDRVVPFDCLEFNPELRWIDVLNDVAFLLMDLDYHGHHDLAAAFLNGYLEHTGDWACCGSTRSTAPWFEPR
jgi:aminoglycoside phosphotransferase family enzyme